MKDYDAVVIGAGLGGLSAAVSLCKAGKRVLLVESHNTPGGYATSFLRGRFEFDASLHELSGVGGGEAKGPLWQLLNAYGITDKVEFIPIPDLYRCVLPKVDMTVPAGRLEFLNTMCDRFPHEARGIKDFAAKVFNFAMEAMQADLLGRGMEKLDFDSLPNLKAHLGHTMAEVCFPLISDPQARAVLSQMCHYVGQPPSRVGFLPYAMALASYLSFGPVHIKGTSQALSQAFVDVIEENGGDVWLNNGASRILVDKGKVTGLVTQDGTEIQTPYIVSNANPQLTCLQLIGPEKTPSWYLKRLAVWTPGLSTFNVFLGLDRECRDLGLFTHETFVGTDYDMDRQYQAAGYSLDADPPGVSVTAYNVADPEFSPPGTSVVALTLGAYPQPWQGLSASQYLDAKSRMVDKALDLAGTVAPDLRGHIEVLEASTPLTNIRYAKNPGGSYTGFAESRMPQNLPQVPSRGPLEGLYFASAWVRVGGGYMPCIFAGHLAARDVMEDMERAGNAAAAVSHLAAATEAQLSNLAEPGGLEESLAGDTLHMLHPERLNLKVDLIIDETPSSKTLRLVPAEGPSPLFQAGQYLNLFVNIDGLETSRPYTISSAPGLPHLDITVRRKENGFVSGFLLDRVRPGSLLESTGPAGSFHLEPLVDTEELVFLAGGSGITPFASILRDMAGRESTPKVHLLYGSRFPDDIIFQDELRSLAQANPAVKVDFVISEPPADWPGPSGLLDADNILALLGTVEGKTFFICGPRQMHELCEKALTDLGVPRLRIKKEAYGPPDNVCLEPGWPGVDPDAEFEVVEERSGKRFMARASEPLMNSLERAGLVAPAVCRSGECAACRTKLASGEVFVPGFVHRRRSDQKSGYIHPCMSYPVQNLRIKL